MGYKVLSNAEIAEGLKKWQLSHNLWKVIRTCPSLAAGTEKTASVQCCDHLACEMQTQSQSGKCGYEVMASYQFLLGHLGLEKSLPGSKTWNAAFSKMTEYERTTVLEIAINKALLVRCDIEIANKGMLIEEITDKYFKGDLISTTTRQVENPSVKMKQTLSKINRESGMSINISERDKDDKKAKLKQYNNPLDNADSPMGKFMKVLSKAAVVVPAPTQKETAAAVKN